MYSSYSGAISTRFWQLMEWETNFCDFLTSNGASLIKAMKNPTSTPLYVRAVYSATCNSGLVGVYSPGLAFIVRSVLSFHFELDWVVIRSWLCLQLMQSERNITFTSQYLKSKSRNLFMIFLIHYVPPKFSDLTTALRLDPKLNYFKINMHFVQQGLFSKNCIEWIKANAKWIPYWMGFPSEFV